MGLEGVELQWLQDVPGSRCKGFWESSMMLYLAAGGRKAAKGSKHSSVRFGSRGEIGHASRP